HLEARLDARADYLLGQDPVDLLGERTHEVDTAARHDEVLETILAKERQQFELRPIDTLRNRPSELWMLSGPEPRANHPIELVGRDVGVGRQRNLEQDLLAERRERLHVVLEERLVRLAFAQRRVIGCELLQTMLREEQLNLHRLLAPERPIVVERRNALSRRHEVRAPFLRYTSDEVDDSRFRNARAPGRQWIIHLIPRSRFLQSADGHRARDPTPQVSRRPCSARDRRWRSPAR